MVTINLKGGLGNQMFQYAYGRRQSIKNNTELVLNIYYLINTNHKDIKRKDYTDLIYQTEKAKIKAIVEKVKELNEKGIKEELKDVVKKGFEEMLQDVMKGKRSIQDFRKSLDYKYSQKKMELYGTLF